MCFGTYDASRVHIPMTTSPHGTKASSLSCPYSFDCFGYPQDFAGALEQIQFSVGTYFAQLLRSRYCSSCSFFPALASSHFSDSLPLTTNSDKIWACSGSPMENSSPASHINSNFALLGYQNVCASQ